MGGWNGDPTALSPQYIIMTNPRGFCPLWAVPRQSGRAVLNELLLSVLARRSPPSPAQLPDRPQPRRPSTSARAAAGPHFGRNRQWRRHRQRRPAEVRGPAPAYAPRQVPGEACCAGAAIFLPEQTSLAKDDLSGLCVPRTRMLWGSHLQLKANRYIRERLRRMDSDDRLYGSITAARSATGHH